MFDNVLLFATGDIYAVDTETGDIQWTISREAIRRWNRIRTEVTRPLTPLALQLAGLKCSALLSDAAGSCVAHETPVSKAVGPASDCILSTAPSRDAEELSGSKTTSRWVPDLLPNDK
jgi:hypothetical protein